ncbi:hypothetical protein DFH06DRAFT_1350147 [Mycena polygramma]|nr:hypothetical protein DFH06DRAFT_1350147 [Mycena polygramma]
MPKERTFPQMTAQAKKTWTENSLETLLTLNDTIVIDDLQAELDQKRFEWEVDNNLLIVCKKRNCPSCVPYKHHFISRLCEDDPDSNEEDDTIDHDTNTPDDSENESMEGDEHDADGAPEPKSIRMMKIIKVRNLLARQEAFEAEGDERAKGSMEGLIVSLEAERLRADDERERAQAAWSIVSKELDELKKSHSSLTESHAELGTRLEAAHKEITCLTDQLTAAVAAAKWQCPDKSAAVWSAMTKPTPEDPPPNYSPAGCKHQETSNPIGITFISDDFALDLRAIRGYNEFRGRAPQNDRGRGSEERAMRHRRTYALLKLLAMPGEYARVIKDIGVRICSYPTYSPLVIAKNPTDADVARLLAAQGMSLATADDAWKYSYTLVRMAAEVGPSDKDRGLPAELVAGAKQLLIQIENRLASSSPPAGKNREEDDRFERPPTLPYKRTHKS